MAKKKKSAKLTNMNDLTYTLYDHLGYEYGMTIAELIPLCNTSLGREVSKEEIEQGMRKLIKNDQVISLPGLDRKFKLNLPW